MLVNMDPRVFKSLDVIELGWACMAPILEPLRGKNPAVKSKVYSELSSGQQRLFMFYAFYNHAVKSAPEFYWWSAYYLAQPGLWSELGTKLGDAGSEDFVRLLKETEEVLRRHNHPRSFDTFDASPEDIQQDALLKQSVISLYATFCEVTLLMRKELGEYVRSHPEEFVQFER